MGEPLFDEFKRALGLDGPTEELWECNPLVVLNADGDILWHAPAQVRYAPGPQRYEGGVGTASSPDGMQTIVEFKLVSIVHRDPLGIEFPLVALMPWGQSGVTINATDPDGHALTLHTGSHADSVMKHLELGGEPVIPPTMS